MKKQTLLTVFMVTTWTLSAGCENSVNNPVGPEISSKDASRVAAADKKAKVSICHETGNGSYRRITVSENALPSHLAHGDALPGTEGLDESCRAVQAPPAPSSPPPIPPVEASPCPCFSASDLAAMDLTFGGAAWQTVGEESPAYTSAYGMFFGMSIEFRAAGAGQAGLDAPYSCKLVDDTAQLLTEMTGITQAESEACRQMIKEAWPGLF